jgi:hypothetical protein
MPAVHPPLVPLCRLGRLGGRLCGKSAPSLGGGGSDCGLCDRDHSDRHALALTSHEEDGAMASTGTYEGWWDLSLIDDRNQRPLLSAFVAIIAVWAMTFLFALF